MISTSSHRQYFFDVYGRRLLNLHAERKKCEDVFLSRGEGDPRGAYDPPDPGTRRFKIQQQLLDTCAEEYDRVKAAMKRAFKDESKAASVKKDMKKRVQVDDSLVAITARLQDGLAPLQQAIDTFSIELSAREREVRALEGYINKAQAASSAEAPSEGGVKEDIFGAAKLELPVRGTAGVLDVSEMHLSGKAREKARLAALNVQNDRDALIHQLLDLVQA